MPCDSSYMNATNLEKELSQVACLLDELDGKKAIDKKHWSGYHPNVYNKSVNADQLVAKLCARLQNADVSKMSLEMQIWWRDHQEADKKRIEAKIQAAQTETLKQLALAKLTAYERKLLRL